MKIKTSLFAAASVGALFSGMAISAHADDAVLTGRMYYDITNIQVKSTAYTAGVAGATTKTNDSTGLDVKRFYIGIDKKFSDTWSMNITTDFEQKATVGRTAGTLPASNDVAEQTMSGLRTWLGCLIWKVSMAIAM